LTYSNNYAVVIIHTSKNHEYYFGNDIGCAYKIYEKSKEQIINDRTEFVQLRIYPTESKMLKYIEAKKAFYNEYDLDIKFNQINEPLCNVKIS
jgi:hypothetical protein